MAKIPTAGSGGVSRGGRSVVGRFEHGENIDPFAEKTANARVCWELNNRGLDFEAGRIYLDRKGVPKKPVDLDDIFDKGGSVPIRAIGLSW